MKDATTREDGVNRDIDAAVQKRTEKRNRRRERRNSAGASRSRLASRSAVDTSDNEPEKSADQTDMQV
jgi:hypothetical protein